MICKRYQIFDFTSCGVYENLEKKLNGLVFLPDLVRVIRNLFSWPWARIRRDVPI